MAGNITIITPKENFLKVPKGVIFNERVDALTLGIFVKVLCLGRKWQMNVPGLAKALGLSVAKIKSAFSILEETGYLRRNRVKGDRGRFVGWDYEISSEPFTDHIEIRPSENSEFGENRPSENWGDINRDNIGNRDIKEEKEDIVPAFNFRKSLLALGIQEQIVDDWMIVRKKAGASNTKTAFAGLVTQIGKASKFGLSAEDCIRTAVENSWRGFKAEWLTKDLAPATTRTPSSTPKYY